VIGGNGYDWSTVVNNNIDFATTTRCGGILADTHPSDSTAREAGVQVRFAPENGNLYDITYNGMQIPQHHLSIRGK